MVEGLKGAPMMLVELSTHQVMSRIATFTPKLNFEDTNRVSVAIGMSYI
jgi:BioD-like phosphotransacetylase family protein